MCRKQRRGGIRAPPEVIRLRAAAVRQNRPTAQRSGGGTERRCGEAKEKVNCSAGARDAALGRMEPAPTRTEGTKIVQDKGRGSQALPGQITPPRNAGRDKGLRDLKGGDRRWSVWLTSGVTGGRNRNIEPSNPHKTRTGTMNLRGSPRGSVRVSC